MTNTSRTVVITGASSGIGFALADAFLARGDNVVGNARSMERLNAAAEKLADASRFLPVAGDKPEKHAFLATLNPSGRIGRVSEIVDAVLYLSGSDFTTGVILPVDGGASAGR
jgi:NAD(P)-dependent dehydrogenase (short-subunit alcohol dehydrogenase family)